MATGKALDRLGLSDASVVKAVAKNLGDPKHPAVAISPESYSEFWDSVETDPTAYVVELIQRVTGLSVSRSRLTKTSNLSAVRTVMNNLLHSLMFLLVYHQLDRTSPLFRKALQSWFDHVDTKLEKLTKAQAKKGSGGPSGAGGVVSEKDKELDSPYERLLLNLYKTKFISNKDITASLVALCASVSVGSEASIVHNPLTGRSMFHAPGDFAYLLPYLQGLAALGSQLEGLVTYTVGLLRAIPVHAKAAPDLVYTCTRCAMMMLRIFTTEHAVPDPAVLASALEPLQILEGWPDPIGAEAALLRNHLVDEIITPGYSLRKRIVEENVLLSPLGEAYFKANPKKAAAWSVTQRAVYIFHSPEDEVGLQMASNLGTPIPFSGVVEGALDDGVTEEDVAFLNEELSPMRSALLGNTLELDLEIPPDELKATIEALPINRLVALSGRARDISVAVHDSIRKRWALLETENAKTRDRSIKHGVPVSTALPTASKEDSVEHTDLEKELSRAGLPMAMGAGHDARASKLRVLYKEMVGGSGAVGVPESRWYSGTTECGAAYDKTGNLRQSCATRLPDLVMHFLEVDEVNTVTYMPSNDDLEAVSDAVVHMALASSSKLDKALDPGSYLAAKAEEPATRRSSSGGDGRQESVRLRPTRPSMASIGEVAVGFDDAASNLLGAWFQFDESGESDVDGVHYPPGSVPYFAPLGYVQRVERVLRQAYMLKGHYNKTRDRRSSVANLGAGTALRDLDRHLGVVRLCAFGPLHVLHGLVCAIVSIKRRHPEIVDALNIRLYVLPSAHHDVADWLAMKDPIYRRQILSPFCHDSSVLPLLAPYEDRVKPIEGDSLSPLVINKHLMQNYFRWAERPLFAKLFDCECWSSSAAAVRGGGSPDSVIPFISRVELGLFVHAKMFQDDEADGQPAGFQPSPMREVIGNSSFSRRFGTSPELVIRYRSTGIDSAPAATAIPAAMYSTVAIANFASPSDGLDQVGAPDDSLLCLHMNSARGAYSGATSKKADLESIHGAALSERDTRVVSLVDIACAKGDPFYIQVDGRHFGPFNRIRVGPSRAFPLPMSVPICTYLQPEVSPGA